MPVDVDVLRLVDLAAIVVSSVSAIVTVLAFFASLYFFRAGQQLQENANRALTAIQEKSGSIEQQVTGMFTKTRDAAIGHQRASVLKSPAESQMPNGIAADERSALPLSALHRQAEDRIKEYLVSRQLPSSGEAVSLLTYHLASTQLELWFERTYAIIFGSQIRLLKILNTRRAEGMSPKEVQEYFARVVQLHPEHAEWAWEQYINYLVQGRTVMEADDRYVITEVGIEFLAWLATTGRTEERAY